MQIKTYDIETQANNEIKGKFVQLVWGGEEYLIFTPFRLHRFHVEILKHFLSDQEIPYLSLNNDHILIKVSNLNVVGGGHFCLDYPRNTLRLFDNSQVYGRFNEFELAQKIAASNHAWRDLQVDIG
jgi:hypothetical protein